MNPLRAGRPVGASESNRSFAGGERLPGMTTLTTRRFAGLAGDLAGAAGDHAPIVLLHGLSFDRGLWQPVLDELAAVDPGRHVLNLDLPGHGETPAMPPHDLLALAQRVRRAIAAAGLDRPVMVGHSVSGALVSVYASKHPARGVVNVDSPPGVAPFARQLKALAPQIRGPEILQVWQRMVDSFRLELLAPEARALVEAHSRPEPDVIRSYWEPLLDMPIPDLEAWIADGMARVRDAGIPYLLIAGAPVPELPGFLRARVEVWPAGGHFPHLAHPRRFAERLAELG
jgi:pimeloyl-ACP methyl ester carboxylesterase